MEIFEQTPQQWTGIPPDRPSRPSPVWLLFAIILGMTVGGAIVYFTVDTSPGGDTAVSTPDAGITTTTPAIDTATTAPPAAGGSAIEVAYQTIYPVEGSDTGFVALVDGSAEVPVAGSVSPLMVDIVEAIPTDLDSDGTDDAVVILVVSSGGTGFFYSAYGVYADPDQTLVTNSVNLGDRIGLDQVSQDPVTGNVTVRYRDHSDAVGFADAPDLQVVSDILFLRSGATEMARGTIPIADAADPQLTATNTITTGGLGPVRVGMTVQEATKAAGLPIIAPTSAAILPSPGCGFARADGLDGVGFMLIDGVIVRVDISSGPIATASGARIGSTEQEIKDLFPDLIEVTPHAYVEGGNYLTLVPTAENLKDVRVVFETDGKVVTSYRAGRMPAVEWIEGCA